MVILIDTNVALDFLTVRQPFYQSARAILQSCASDDVQGYIAFHSLPNIFYILRKNYSDEDRRSMLKKLCLVLLYRKLISVARKISLLTTGGCVL